MRKLKAEHLRFAILAARERYEPERITPQQRDFLERRRGDGWMIGDRWTIPAYDREYRVASERWLKWNQDPT